MIPRKKVSSVKPIRNTVATNTAIFQGTSISSLLPGAASSKATDSTIASRDMTIKYIEVRSPLPKPLPRSPQILHTLKRAASPIPTRAVMHSQAPCITQSPLERRKSGPKFPSTIAAAFITTKNITMTIIPNTIGCRRLAERLLFIFCPFSIKASIALL